MKSLDDFAPQSPFDLDGLVKAANELLPQFLPDEPEGGARFSEEVNPRLVRYLATLGLLDEAGREGREARYEMRHLLQLLVVRRLMAEGHTTAAIKKMTANVEDSQLRSLLAGQTRAVLQSDSLEVEAYRKAPKTNAALEFLQNIAQKSPGPMAPPISSQKWQRIEIASGLELHRRDDFTAPTTPHEREKLLRRIENELKLKSGKRSSRR